MKAAALLLASSLGAVSSMVAASAYQVSCSTPASSPLVVAIKKEDAGSGYENCVQRFDGLRFIETLVTAHR